MSGDLLPLPHTSSCFGAELNIGTTTSIPVTFVNANLF
jgi:hypothetical protein